MPAPNKRGDELRVQLDAQRPEYEALGRKLVQLVGAVLKAAGVRYESVSFRVKTSDSALQKAARPDVSIASVADLHDFLGLRVITYFEDQVDEVVNLLAREFSVDSGRTKDRRQTMDPDRFGYLSVHMAISLDEQRSRLPEWAQFSAFVAEVQIRSALQHAWAEIEHDLGYKTSAGSIPDHLRRRFSRLAGLLELADDEFMALRSAIGDYEREVAEQLRRGQDVELNQASLSVFVSQDERLRALDERIAKTLGVELHEAASHYYVQHRAEELREVGISTIRELSLLLDAEGDRIAALASEWLGRGGGRTDYHIEEEGVSPGVCLFYVYLSALAARGADDLPESVDGFGYREERQAFVRLAVGDSSSK